MNKFWIILGHTYLEKMKSKTFIITTALMLLLVVAAANFQTIADFFVGGEDEKDQIAVIDHSDTLFEPYKQSVEAANDSLELISYDSSEDAGKAAVEEEEFAALVVMQMNEEGRPEATYYANNITDSFTQSVLEEQLQQIKVALSIEQAGFDEQAIQEIYAPVNFETVALDQDAKTLEEMFQAQGIVYVMLFFMYMVVILYGQMIAQDVANEKSSRVMEILISSASPVTHMFAKIFGVALVGLTQIFLLVGVGYTLIISRKEELVGSFLDEVGLVDIPVDLIIYAIIFFLLGYMLYATLAAMLGSLVSRSEDVGQLIMPMIILIVIAFLVAIFGLRAPESTIVTISSFIPFFTPMVMILRIGMLSLPIWEIGLSIVILIISIIILGLIGARVYKGGVLMYGRTGSLKDFTKAIRLSKKEK
ncbi:MULTISPECIES: ABC transporter permease [unclassified Oceanobacillus]|uniref:ABC transporter permease n=1 Tax=unclassified Oceanobacillus TaxID=2630292 RepID=UPI0012EB65CB|nr:ABC transporter permease [Oceanobacillus sp. AG]